MANFISGYEEVFLFFGILVIGLPVLLPAVYGSLHGFLDPVSVMSIAFCAGVLSDFIWYGIGWQTGEMVFSRFSFLRKRKEEIERLRSLFQFHSFRIMCIARFAYGTKIVANVVAGVSRMKPALFGFASIGSMLTWILLLYGAAYFIGNIALLQKSVVGFHIGFLLLILVSIGSALLFKRLSR